MTSKFTEAQFDKAGFLGLIQVFLNKVDELAPTGTASKKTGLDLENAMNEILQNFKYVCSVSFGYGKFANSPSITFAPIKILNKDLVNSDKLSPTKGAYIYFCYFYKENEIILDIGYSDEKPPKCEAKNAIDKHRNNKEWIYKYNRKNFEKIKDKIAEDFLGLVDEFNQIPLEDFKIEEQEMAKSKENSHKNPPLNQILYGPPGTGKTYSTINRALEILHAYGEITQIPSERGEAKAEFDKFRKNGQIEFVTFHQSFSYEEFVEGIKPIFVDENGEEVEHSKNMIYRTKGGIFKEICERALENLNETLNKKGEYRYNFYNMFNNKLRMANGKMNIKGIEFEFGEREFKSGETLIFKSYIERYLRDIEGANKDKLDDMIGQTYPEHTQKYKAVLEYYLDEISKFKEKPYILIIDEINRGNISKILGELITLIEPSKRIGASADERARGVGDEGLRVTLPYSKDIFGVPSNLYIIGTMNTADRSIALLDTALRRRFEFVEMMPRAEFLGGAECDGVNLQNLLEKMNERIEFLLDREHTIGHSFFIGVDSLAALRGVFAKKIIPLLQEYFYDDYAKIQAVLNDNGMISGGEKAVSAATLFPKKHENLDLEDKFIYSVTPLDSEIWLNPQTYKDIYSQKAQNNGE